MNMFLIVLGMSIVTFVPRLLPVFMVDRFNLPAWAKRWLNSIPYAALGALIFPGILGIQKDNPFVGLAGGLVAAAIAYFRMHIMYAILGSILTVLIINAF